MDRMLENRELISDLADGRLDDADAAKLLAQMSADDDAAVSWDIYHLSRDVLRGEWGMAAGAADAALGLSPDFMVRLRTRLTEERIEPMEPLPQPMPVMPQTLQAEAANQPLFRWRMVAGLASVVAVAAVGWGVMGQLGSGRFSEQLAVNSAPTSGVQAVTVSLPGDERAVMLRDPRLDELLAAHKQAAGASALQTPAGFLRNATFEGASR